MPIIRHSKLADIPEIASIHVDSWRTTYCGQISQQYLDSLSVHERELSWREAFAYPKGFMLVAEGSEGLAGFISFGPLREKDVHPDSAEIYAIYLLEKCKGRGIGTKLWQAACELLVENKFTEVSLWVLKSNTAAQKYYEKMGCVFDGSEKADMIGDQPVIELCYKKVLVN